MRTIRFVRTSLLTLLLVTITLAAPLWAAITRTNLVAAITADMITFEIGSVTGLLARQLVWIDDEAMRVVTVPSSGGVITVQRGTDGTRAVSHVVSSIVHYGPGQDFETWVDAERGGDVTSAAIRATGKLRETATVTTLATAAAETYTTAQLLGGLILRDPNGAARTDTTPTAALLIAAFPRAKVGDYFEFTVRNTADAAETITVAGGTGGTISGTATIAQNNSKRFGCRLDSATAYTCFSLGTVTH